VEICKYPQQAKERRVDTLSEERERGREGGRNHNTGADYPTLVSESKTLARIFCPKRLTFSKLLKMFIITAYLLEVLNEMLFILH
jgi:hypothetical protein